MNFLYSFNLSLVSTEIILNNQLKQQLINLDMKFLKIEPAKYRV